MKSPHNDSKSNYFPLKQLKHQHEEHQVIFCIKPDWLVWFITHLNRWIGDWLNKQITFVLKKKTYFKHLLPQQGVSLPPSGTPRKHTPWQGEGSIFALDDLLHSSAVASKQTYIVDSILMLIFSILSLHHGLSFGGFLSTTVTLETWDMTLCPLQYGEADRQQSGSLCFKLTVPVSHKYIRHEFEFRIKKCIIFHSRVTMFMNLLSLVKALKTLKVFQMLQSQTLIFFDGILYYIKLSITQQVEGKIILFKIVFDSKNIKSVACICMLPRLYLIAPNKILYNQLTSVVT